MLQEINKEMLICLNSLTSYDFIQIIALLFSDTPILFLPVFLSIMWVYYTYKKNVIKKENLLYIFYSVLLWISISIIIQQIVYIERPEEALKWVWQLLLKHIPDASFPSDHATVSFAFLTSLFYTGFRKLWIIFFPIVIVMLLSRVILWVHWPFDIVAWIAVWIFSSFITFKYLIKINTIKKINKFIIKITSYIKL